MIGGSAERIKNKKKINGHTKEINPKPLNFFGTWKDVPLDPKTYRKTLWRQTPEL